MGIPEKGHEPEPQAAWGRAWGGAEAPLPWKPDPGASSGCTQLPRVTQRGYLGKPGSQENHTSPHPRDLVFVKCMKSLQMLRWTSEAWGENKLRISALESGAQRSHPGSWAQPHAALPSAATQVHSGRASPAEHDSFLLQVLRPVPREGAAGHAQAQQGLLPLDTETTLAYGLLPTLALSRTNVRGRVQTPAGSPAAPHPGRALSSMQALPGWKLLRPPARRLASP